MSRSDVDIICVMRLYDNVPSMHVLTKVLVFTIIIPCYKQCHQAGPGSMDHASYAVDETLASCLLSTLGVVER